MKKIKSLFKRNYDGDRLVYNEVVEGCEWVQNEGGIATRKFDGTACMIKDNYIYKRYDVKNSRKVPENAIPCELERNEKTGHWPHWVKANFENKEDQYFLEGWKNVVDILKYYWGFTDNHLKDGTYELCGPKINGNNDKFSCHLLIPHGRDVLSDISIDFDSIKQYLKEMNIEGIVWHHRDGRMVKIKKKDFGFKRF